MGIIDFIIITILWSLTGFLILFLWYINSYMFFEDILNPIEIYRYYNVNYFGAFVLFLIRNLLSPLFTVGYWFYKLCTVRA